MITTIAFDADDTLWHSEGHVVVTEERFVELIGPWAVARTDTESAVDLTDRLLARESANLALFGYGVKGFTPSMIETAIEISDGTVPASAIEAIIGWARRCWPMRSNSSRPWLRPSPNWPVRTDCCW